MSNAITPSSTPYIVTWPRASDAIGTALREAYCGGGRLPDDMTALLLKLHACGCRHGRG